MAKTNKARRRSSRSEETHTHSQQGSSSQTDIVLPEELEGLNRRQLLQHGFSVSGFATAGQLLRMGSLGGRFAGLGLGAFFGARDQRLIAQEAARQAPQRRLVWINMRGGWDILETVDPKERNSDGVTISYPFAQALPLAGAGGNVRMGRWMPRLAAAGQDALLLRGLAMGTTSHNAGSVYMETGVLSNAGQVNSASIPAIVASESQATIPIIQLNGGSDPRTDRGLLNPVSVVRASNLRLYQGMYPEGQLATQRRLGLLDYVRSSIDRLQQNVGTSDRLTDLSSAESKIRDQFNSNVGQSLQLTDQDRQPFLSGAPQGINRGALDSFALAYKMLENDLVTCVNLGIGGFDTHSNQSARLQPILNNVDYLVATLLEQLRLTNQLDNTLVVLYSDFGRTPRPNNSNGRDHWPVGGAMMLGGGIAGGRVVGASDEDLRSLDIDPVSGNVVTEGGIQLNPTHLGGSVLELTLGSAYLQYRPYLQSIGALTRLR